MNWVRALGLALVTSLTCVPHNASAGDEPYRAVVDTDGIQRVSILGGSYFFKPDHIIVKANVPVELSVRVEPGVIPHSFVLKASEAGITINAKLSTDPKKITFTPVAPGKYSFYCSNKLLFFRSHQDRGMEGILEVVE
jgi:plastocyanin domain-containing protein